MTENFNFGRTQRRPSDPSCHCHCVHACKKPPSHHLLPIKASTHRLMLPKFSIFIQDQIQDSHEQTHPCHLSSHGRAFCQGYRNFADLDPLFFINSFNYHTTSTSSIFFTAAVPEAFNSFPLFFMASFFHHNFLLSTSPNIGPVVRFFIVFSEDVAHIGLDQIFGSREILLPPLMQEPLTCTDFLLVFALHCEITIYPFADHLTVSTQL